MGSIRYKVQNFKSYFLRKGEKTGLCPFDRLHFRVKFENSDGRILIMSIDHKKKKEEIGRLSPVAFESSVLELPIAPELFTGYKIIHDESRLRTGVS